MVCSVDGVAGAAAAGRHGSARAEPFERDSGGDRAAEFGQIGDIGSADETPLHVGD
jgi:hypothetical protein